MMFPLKPLFSARIAQPPKPATFDDTAGFLSINILWLSHSDPILLQIQPEKNII